MVGKIGERKRLTDFIDEHNQVFVSLRYNHAPKNVLLCAQCRCFSSDDVVVVPLFPLVFPREKRRKKLGNTLQGEKKEELRRRHRRQFIKMVESWRPSAKFNYPFGTRYKINSHGNDNIGGKGDEEMLDFIITIIWCAPSPLLVTSIANWQLISKLRSPKASELQFSNERRIVSSWTRETLKIRMQPSLIYSV